MITLPWLDDNDLSFPPPSLALDEPNGLLAAGGDLRPERLLSAYRQGIFPWFNREDPILWWSPSPRTVVFPERLHISKSLRKVLKRNDYRVTFDHAFEQVMRNCAAPRNYTAETWISEDIIRGYSALHRQGCAHSVEVWKEDELVGGLYGVVLGKVFFGESMFSRADNASKIGFAYLVRQLVIWDIQVIDCQVASDHLMSLGAEEISREKFQHLLQQFVPAQSPYPPQWSSLSLEPWH